MTKFAHDDVIDGGPLAIKNNCTRQVACSQVPTTYTEANATYKLADVTMSSTDFTIQNRGAGGREIVIAAKSGVTIDTAGTSTHVALLDVANSKLLFVTEGVVTLTTGTVDYPSWKIAYPDPV